MMMKRMKFPPLAIFILLLVVLIFTAIWGKYIPEGFIAYNKAAADMSTVTMPYYGKSVYKLYDSLYFDATNGNVLELFGASDSAAAGASTGANAGAGGSGSAGAGAGTAGDIQNVTSMVLMPRTGSTIYTINTTTTTPPPTFSANVTGNTLNAAYQSWSIPTSSSPLPSAQYQVSYLPWNQDTFIHIYDSIAKKHIGLYSFFKSSGSVSENLYKSDQAAMIPTATAPDSHPSNGKVATVAVYDPKKASNVFQLTSNVFFDMTCGYLLVQNTNSSMDVYNGNVDTAGVPLKAYTAVTAAGIIASGATPLTRSGTGTSTSTTPFLVSAGGGTVVLYKYLGDSLQRTLVVVFSADSNLLRIQYVGRFNPSSATGIDIDPATSPPPPAGGGGGVPPAGGGGGVPPAGGGGGGGPPGVTAGSTLDDVINAYYLQNYGIGTGTGSGGGTSCGSGNNNYMRKTQIIPPVCPTCPSYSSNCTTCNASTGTTAGTSAGTTAGTAATTTTNKDNDKDGSGNNIRSDIKGAAGDVWGGVKEVGSDVKGGVGDVYGGVKQVGSDVKGAIGGAYGEVKEVGSEVKGAVGDIGSGIKGAVGDIYGGIKGAVGDVYGGVKGVGKDVYGGVKDVGDDVYDGAKRLGSHIKDEYREQNRNSRGTAGNMRGDLQGNMGYAGNGSGSGVRYITGGASPMTYYGAASDRGSSEFLPVTADFSRFGR
jgi:hypothetical protein